MSKTKKQKSIQKTQFLETYSDLIIKKHYPNVKIYPNFLKVIIDGVEWDYYPGAERGFRVHTKSWFDISIPEFLKMLNIK